MGESTRKELKVRIFNQDRKYSCWLAAYQMLLAYESRKHAVADIREAFRKAEIDFKYAFDQGLDEGLFPDACAALDLRTGGGLPFGTREAEKGGVKTLLKWFKHNGPLWVAGKWEGSKHINVVCGADTKTEQLCRIDPWSPNGVSKSEAEWVNFDRYVSKITDVKGGTQWA